VAEARPSYRLWARLWAVGAGASASATTALPVLAGNRAGCICSGGRDDRGRRCIGCGSNATIDSTPVTCRNSPYSSGWRRRRPSTTV